MKTYIIKTIETVYYLKATRFTVDDSGVYVYDSDNAVGFFPIEKLLSIVVETSLTDGK